MAQRAERDTIASRPYINRKTNYQSAEVLGSSLIKLITGPRRSGKSVFAFLLLKGHNFAYLNFDDKQLLDRWDEELVEKMLDEVYPDYEYLMLDEVQNLSGWDMWVSKLYRNGRNLVITGSNANMLSSEMATVLTGRYLQIEMLPFSLAEVMETNGLDIADIKEEHKTRASLIVDDYLRNGGFPESVLARGITKNYLSTLFDSILLKDVAQRHHVRKTTDLYGLATYLLSNFCNPFSANDLAGELNIASVTTTKKYCEYLNEPYLFFYLPRFNNKLKLMAKADRKAYIVDNGFVQSSAFNLSDNLGRLLENQVFVELLRSGYVPGQTLFYYRSRNNREVDFVTRRGPKVERMIQVSYSLDSAKTRKRETSALMECGEELKCDNLFIVTFSEKETIDASVPIQVIPITEI